jgi:4-hydroxy-3-polyprenylbenzoate decarboxylase
MGFRSLKSCVEALRAEGQAVVVDHPVDPHLEIAEIQRRLFRAHGPAVLFTRPRDTAFPVLVNLYGTKPRIKDSPANGTFATDSGLTDCS